MKKVIRFSVLALALLCLLCSCFSLSNENRHEIEPTAAPSESKDGETPTAAPQEEKLSIEETVCFSWNGLTVTAKSIEVDSFWGTTEMKLLVENGTDKAYRVGCRALIVNNYMISDLFSCEVAAGKKANDTLTISSGGLEDAGIQTIGLIEIYFYVYDADTWETVYDAPVTVIRTNLYDKMDGNEPAGQLLYDKNGVKIIGLCLKEDAIWGKEILFCVENTTDRTVLVSSDDLSVNGFMVGGYLSATVYPGKYCVDDISLSDSDLENNGIETVEEVELSFRIYGDDSLFPIEKTDPIAFSVK